MQQLARYSIAFAFDNARSEVIVAQCQVRISPSAVQAQERRRSLFAQLRAWHIAIVTVFVGMGQTLAPAHIPHKTFLMSGEVATVAEQPVVRLILAADVCLHRTSRQDGSRLEQQNAGHGVAAVHQACRAT